MVWFLFVKFFAYSAFIYFGYQIFRGDKIDFIFKALAVALVRLIAGLILGWVFLYLGISIFRDLLFSDISTDLVSNIAGLLLILPSSLVLWLITAKYLARRMNRPAFAWASGGLAISVVLDIYALINVDSWHVFRGWC